MARRREIGTDEVLQLWLRFTEFQMNFLEPSTIARDYHKIAKRLCKMPDLPTAVAIRDWLLQNYATETARRTVDRLSACCDWAVSSRYIQQNPFTGLTLKRQRRKKSWIDTRAFTAQERDIIIDALASDAYVHKCSYILHSHYANWVRFLFWVGCRLEEAAPLRWEHIASDYSAIHFREAFPMDVKILGDIKTHECRDFPCNDRLKGLLRSLPKTGPYLFPSPKGHLIDYQNFPKRTWNPLLKKLVAEGKIREVLPPGHARHTFITLALEAGMTPKDVAQLVGNSPETINKYYAAPKPAIDVPEF
jgi:integrase